ncbi:MAG: DJ-1/PfpI family protein [Pseudomonadota bacterium]
MRTLAALVFPGFQTLDFFGPIEMLGDPVYDIKIVTVAKNRTPVPSRHGQRIAVDKCLADGTDYDLLLVPGGDAALAEGKDPEMLQWIKDVSINADCVMAVCTGTILLAMTGLLDGRKATTNKLDFLQTVPLAPNVDWIRQARWVEDGKFFTSSGVSAGIDMALAALASLYGADKAAETAYGSEYTRHTDASDDPFAKMAGLV